jgi:hypothetical protein
VTYGYWQKMVRLAVECADRCKGSIAAKGMIAVPGFAWNVLALIAPMESRPDLETIYGPAHGPAPKMEYTPGAYVAFDAASWEKYVAPLRAEVALCFCGKTLDDCDRDEAARGERPHMRRA